MHENDAVTLRKVDESSAPGVCDLYRKIYGDDFPFPGVYDPRAILEANREGRQVNLVALDGDTVVGQAVTVCSPGNPRLYEMVGLMVLPEARSGGVGRLLARELLEVVFPSLDWAARYTESTTAHVNSQKVDLKMGHLHPALALDILPSTLLSHDSVFEGSSRGSCLMSFFENSGVSYETVLPARYAGVLEDLAGGFRERNFVEDDANTGWATSLHVIPFAEARTVYVPVNRFGADLEARLDEALGEVADMASVQLQLPLVSGVTAAVETARERGFFLGGFLPQWFAGGDGLLLQRTETEPDWDSIHVLTARAESLMESVRRDRESL